MADGWSLEKNSPQTLQPAGCPVDWLGLTEAVTHGVPGTLLPSGFRCGPSLIPVPGTACVGWISPYSRIVARECPWFPRPRVLRNSP